MRALLALIFVAAAALPASALGVGDPAPDFNAPGNKWFNSSATTLADLRGRVIVLEIFRTW